MISAADVVIPKFHDVLGDVMAHGHTHYWMFGGARKHEVELHIRGDRFGASRQS